MAEVSSIMVNVTHIATNITNFESTGQFAANATGGLFWGVVLIAFFVVLLFRLARNWGWDDALLSGSFICFVLSLIFLRIGYIGLIYVLIFGFIMAATILYKKISSR